MKYAHVSASVPVDDSPFRIESLDAAPPPDGGQGAWTRYVISQGGNMIVGMRAGQSGDVRSAIAHMVEQLNERFAKQRGKAAR